MLTATPSLHSSPCAGFGSLPTQGGHASAQPEWPAARRHGQDGHLPPAARPRAAAVRLLLLFACVLAIDGPLPALAAGVGATQPSLTADGIRLLGGTIRTMAANEQLDAHKNAVTIRLNTL